MSLAVFKARQRYFPRQSRHPGRIRQALDFPTLRARMPASEDGHSSLWTDSGAARDEFEKKNDLGCEFERIVRIRPKADRRRGGARGCKSPRARVDADRCRTSLPEN